MTLVYKGGGSLIGVPARDLTDEEAEEFGRQWLLDSGLYAATGGLDDAAKGKPRPQENKVAAGPQENKGEV